MIRRFGPMLLILGVLFGQCAWAQTDTGTTDTGAPVQPGPQPAYIYPDTTPSLDFLSQSIENSSITLGIGAGFSYDSNAYSSTGSAQNFWLFHIGPSIKIQQFFPKFSWNLSYAPGYQVYTNVSGPSNPNSNLFSQHASGGFLWQLSPHWQLIGSDNFTYSANPFDSFLATPGTPTMNNPNPVSYYPLTQYTLNTGLLTLTDRLTKADTLSFSGSENLRRTSTYNLLTAYPFYNLVSYGGRANYAHQLSPRLTLGAGYDYNSLDFGHGQQRSGVQTISMTADYLIRPNMTISGWIGPEYTSTKTIVGIPILGQTVYLTTYGSLWSTSLGANFGWQSLRNSVQAGFVRQVSDGGGIIGTSQANSVNANYRRKITAKMDVLLGARYLHDVSTTVSSRQFNNFYINTGLTYKFAKSLTATGQYTYVHYNQSNTILLGAPNYNSNIVGVSVNYTWNHPLGR
ncbi:MAG: hypothetical protein WBS19_05295 [Candidatus Korobacteraceae bacterium]